jgi:ribosomal protein S18 acetylase RimI-like enzyme
MTAVRHSFELKPLDWDTAFFGARMGTIATLSSDNTSDPASLASELRDLLADARADGYAHLTLRALCDDTAAIHAAESAGLRLVDVGVDSTFSVDKSPMPGAPSDTRIRTLRREDVATLSELAAEAFTLSRFSADPFFSAEQVREFHHTWARNLCSGLAQGVLVADMNGSIAGFVSCAVSGAEGRIPLIGVDSRFRGQRVGQALVTAALHWFHDAGCRVVHVKTQAHNYRALALYHRAGFVVTRSELTFSVTLSSAANTSREVPQ